MDIKIDIKLEQKPMCQGFPPIRRGTNAHCTEANGLYTVDSITLVVYLMYFHWVFAELECNGYCANFCNYNCGTCFHV